MPLVHPVLKAIVDLVDTLELQVLQVYQEKMVWWVCPVKEESLEAQDSLVNLDL